MAKNNRNHRAQKGNGLSRPEQIHVGDNLMALIRKEVSIIYRHKYQGPGNGSVASMVIYCDSRSFKSSLVTYIKKSFNLDPSEEAIINHGDIDKTLIINLSELPMVYVTAIETKCKLVFPNGYKKIRHIKDAEIKAEVVKAEVVKDTESSKKPTERSSSRTMGVSKFLASVLTHEIKITSPGMNITYTLQDFCYYDKKVDDYNVINCNRFEIAEKVEKAINWFFKNNEALLVDTTVMYKIPSESVERKQSNINFCFPPNVNSNVDEITRRLERVSKGSSPVVVINEGGTYVASYHKKTMVPKITPLLKGMGWEVSNIGGEIIIFVDSSNKKVITTPAVDSIPNSKEEVIIKGGEEILTPIITSLEKKEEEILTPVITPLEKKEEEISPSQSIYFLVDSKEDARRKLHELFMDDKLFSKLSLETQKRIIYEFRDEFISEHTEDYALGLLFYMEK